MIKSIYLRILIIKFAQGCCELENELIYISRSIIPGSKQKKLKKHYYKQVCIYAFNQKELKLFSKKIKK